MNGRYVPKENGFPSKSDLLPLNGETETSASGSEEVDDADCIEAPFNVQTSGVGEDRAIGSMDPDSMVSPNLNEPCPAVDANRVEESRLGIFARLARFKSGTILSEDDLAKVLGKCKESVKRAVGRQELPPPVRFFGSNVWTVDAIVEHIRDRLDEHSARQSKQRH